MPAGAFVRAGNNQRCGKRTHREQPPIVPLDTGRYRGGRMQHGVKVVSRVRFGVFDASPLRVRTARQRVILCEVFARNCGGMEGLLGYLLPLNRRLSAYRN